MANPQPDRFTRISNDILEALCKIRISGECMQILLSVLRKTYGYNIKQDSIKLNQFNLMTGINKPCICRAINKLIKMNIIIKKDNNLYRFQKDFDCWKPLSKKITLSKKIISVIKKDNLALSKKIMPLPIIKDIDKRHLNKDIKNYTFSDLKKAVLLKTLILKNNTKAIIKRKHIYEWACEISKMFRIDHRSYKDIGAVIRWSQQDSFWHKNILSGNKLRIQFDKLFLNMKPAIEKKVAGVPKLTEYLKCRKCKKPAILVADNLCQDCWDKEN